MEALRNLLTAYAYNICGSYEEARDIVQDVYLQFMVMDTSFIENKEAYLKRMVINLSVNRKKVMQKQLKTYPGEWLPEPIATEGADTALNRKEILSYSLMVLLEKLNPSQRAVFILKEAFDYDHSEIAEVLGIKPEYSRQLLTRAKKKLEASDTENFTTANVTFLSKYLDVIRLGDTRQLESLLTEDITVTSDGGGKVRAGINPLSGKRSASAFVLGIYKKFYKNRYIEQGVINHQPALFYYGDNILETCQVFAFENDSVSRIFFIRNPDKLKSIRKPSPKK
ncbi:MAG TPA: sigma-70 family RNA polymerase sigma factor [Sphingobacteriaceae bacterium]